jgi:hypothetical protein
LVQIFKFNAIVDIVTKNTIWELKCTNDITFEHKIQVVIYAWIWRLTYENTNDTKPKIFRILNIKTGEVWKLNSTIEQLTPIIVVLLKKIIKFNKEINENADIESDETFINMHH